MKLSITCLGRQLNQKTDQLKTKKLRGQTLSHTWVILIGQLIILTILYFNLISSKQHVQESSCNFILGRRGGGTFIVRELKALILTPCMTQGVDIFKLTLGYDKNYIVSMHPKCTIIICTATRILY